MAKVLFFFTAEYPFGSGETFVENEMIYLEKAFDRIMIISNNCKNNQTRTIPAKSTIERFPYELNFFQTLLSLFGLFSPLFWKEYSTIKSGYKKKTSFVIFKTMLISLRKSKVFGKNFIRIIKKHSTADEQIYCYSYWANDTAFALSQLKARLPKARMFCRAHGWDVYFERHPSEYLPYRLPILEKLDAVFTISSDGKRYMEHLFSRQFNNLNISRLGVNKQTYTNPAHDFNIITISSIIPVKNLITLSLALSCLDFNFTWYHIGDGAQKAELEQSAQKNIPGKYRFTGRLPNEEVLHFLSATPMSLFMNISLSEGIPVSIMEAMSLGIPVIATHVGGNSEIVKDAFNGFLLPPNPSPADVAESIKKFRQLSDEEKTQMRKNAYETWDTEYNAERNYTDFIKKIFEL